MGEVFALGAAVIWAFAVILLQRSGESVGPFALSFFRMTLSLPLLLITTWIFGQISFRAPLGDYLILIASGIIGIAISDTLFHKSLNMVGAGISAIVGTSYSPTVALMAFLLIGERVGALDLLGMVLILSAILLSTTLRPIRKRTRREVIEGVLLGVLSIALLAFAIVIAKPVLDRWPSVLWAASVRQAGCFAALLLATLVFPGARGAYRTLRPGRAWRVMIPATFLGSYLSLILWIAGMKYTLATLAAILNQTSTIFILLLAVVFLHEPFTRRKALAAALALAGVLLITIL